MKFLTPLLIALFLGAVSTGAVANRFGNNGVPADLYGELQAIKQQLVSLQQTVGALTETLEDVAWNGHELVAVGSHGRAAVSPEIPAPTTATRRAGGMGVSAILEAAPTVE